MKCQENNVYCYTDIHIYVICCNNKILIFNDKWQYEISQENNSYCCTSIHIISVKCCNIKVLIEINIY